MSVYGTGFGSTDNGAARGVDHKARARNWSVAGLLGLACLGASANSANAQADPAAITANIVNSAVQSAIQDARDRIYRMQAQPSGRPLGFAPDAEFDSAFPALQYGPGDR